MKARRIIGANMFFWRVLVLLPMHLPVQAVKRKTSLNILCIS